MIQIDLKLSLTRNAWRKGSTFWWSSWEIQTLIVAPGMRRVMVVP